MSDYADSPSGGFFEDSRPEGLPFADEPLLGAGLQDLQGDDEEGEGGAGGDEGDGGGSAQDTPAAGQDLMDVDTQERAKTEGPPVRAPSSSTVDPNLSSDGSGLPVKIKDLDPAPSSATKLLIQQTHEIIIPSYAAWFNIARVNDIERKALPEFFNNKNKSKTPQVYKDYRDFMINTYRLNPTEYLTVTACRRNLAGDVCAIIRVHAFLEQWGLINYQVDPDSRPSTVGPAFTGHFRVTADTPRGLQPLYPSVPLSKSTDSKPPIPAQPSQPSENTAKESSVARPGLILSKNIFESQKRPGDEPDDLPDAKKTKHSCSTCGVDCTSIRYHNTKIPHMEICPNCYLEGRFPSTTFSGDFLRMEHRATQHASEEDWSDQETLLLLEALEMFDEDWVKVAEHVGTRTRDQCILKFLQMPIEDPYLGREANALGPLQYHRVPFTAADNPVLSLTAFLASVVPPDVAAAAAKGAVQKLGGLKEEGGTETKTVQKVEEPAEPETKAAAAESGAAGKSGDEGQPVEKTEEPSGDSGDAVTVEKSAAGEHTPAASDPAASTTPATTAAAPPPTESTSALAAKALEKAAATALGAAAAKSTVLARHQETEMRDLTMALVHAQMKKMELKLKHFEELEGILEHERKEVERDRQKLYLERLAFRRTVLGAAESKVGSVNQGAAVVGKVDVAGKDGVPGRESAGFMITIG
ncbi:hypothetical protein HK104_000821 [Borealophlyctis nickersoniae]|nr:hypothetical protein HK104_000821 [Borealophlyctis nickersoniae]